MEQRQAHAQLYNIQKLEHKLLLVECTRMFRVPANQTNNRELIAVIIIIAVNCKRRMMRHVNKK